MNNKRILVIWRTQDTKKRQRLLKIRRFFMGHPYTVNKLGDVWYLPKGGK